MVVQPPEARELAAAVAVAPEPRAPRQGDHAGGGRGQIQPYRLREPIEERANARCVCAAREGAVTLVTSLQIQADQELVVHILQEQAEGTHGHDSSPDLELEPRRHIEDERREATLEAVLVSALLKCVLAEGNVRRCGALGQAEGSKIVVRRGWQRRRDATPQRVPAQVGLRQVHQQA